MDIDRRTLFTAAAVTSSSFDEQFGSPPRTTSLALERTVMTQNPGTNCVELDSNGWTLLDVTGERVQAEYLFVDTVLEPSSGQRLDATWQVWRGENRLSAGESRAPTVRTARRRVDVPDREER